MAATAKLFWELQIEVDGRVIRIPPEGHQVPTAWAVTGPGVQDDTFSVANGATATIWTSAAPTTTFQLLAILSDQSNVMVEAWGTTVASNHHFELAAGLPFLLASDDTQAYAAGGGFAGAAQDFTRFDVKNNSGSTALIRRVVVA